MGNWSVLVIAALAGTRAVIDPADAAMIRGFIVNKFRGDPALFTDGYAAIEQLTRWRGYGVVPWLAKAHHLPSEDAVVLERAAAGTAGPKRIACPILPRIANFDDLDALKSEPSVELVMVPPDTPIPVVDMIVLPGSKATIADLGFIREQGWDIDIIAHHRRGGTVLGICGGYQMLGRSIDDPLGIEGAAGRVKGLDLLDVETVLTDDKRVSQMQGRALDAGFEGYEIHIGQTTGPDTTRPFAMLGEGHADGARSADGTVMGTYCHGLLESGPLRRALLAKIDAPSHAQPHADRVDAALEDIAATLEEALDIDGLIALARENVI